MNYDIMHFFSQHISTAAINLILFMFFGNIYHGKYDRKIIYIAVFTVWTGIMYWVNSYNIGILNLVFFFITAEIICLSLFDTNFGKSWLYNAFFLLLLSFNDVITYVLWSVLLKKTSGELPNEPQLLIISNLLNVLLSFAEYRILVSLLEKSEIKIIKRQEAAFLLFMTVMECYIIHSLSKRIASAEDGITTVIVLLSFLVCNIYITYIIRKVSGLYKYKYDTELAAKQSSIQLEQFVEMEQTYREARHIIHDMKKHLAVISDLNNSESAEYGMTLEKKFQSLFGCFECSNRILSIIIGRKHKTAEDKGICVKMDIEDIDLDFMDDLDITGIFANLWDNAIEACEKTEPGKRKILFIMNKVNGFIIINMENSYDKAEYMKMQTNSLKTTKENHMGLGLSVIKNTVEKYDGLFNIIPDSSKFVVEITIPTAG
ncbi:MAG: GHKL domain-containing protein [Ruminococcus sp.]|nr:GHKL domain-containing protein [Ruminococcus sp.]